MVEVSLVLEQTRLVEFLVVLFLTANVLADRTLIDPHGGQEIPPRPEVVTFEVPIPTHESAGRPNRTLAFDVSDHVRNSMLWWNSDHHMHVVRAQMTFQDLTLPLFGQFVKHLPEVATNLSVEHFSTALRDEHNVLLALPSRMT
jgi:hypothetical protein